MSLANTLLLERIKKPNKHLKML